MSEGMETQSEEFDLVAFREHEDHENRVYLVKVIVGVVVLLALAALINHQLVKEFGQADGDLISMIGIPIVFTAVGMLLMGIMGEV